MLRTPLPPTVTVAGCLIAVSDKLKKPGVTLDAALAFADYAIHVLKHATYTYLVCAKSAASFLVRLLVPWRLIFVTFF